MSITVPVADHAQLLEVATTNMRFQVSIRQLNEEIEGLRAELDKKVVENYELRKQIDARTKHYEDIIDRQNIDFVFPNPNKTGDDQVAKYLKVKGDYISHSILPEIQNSDKYPAINSGNVALAIVAEEIYELMNYRYTRSGKVQPVSEVAQRLEQEIKDQIAEATPKPSNTALTIMGLGAFLGAALCTIMPATKATTGVRLETLPEPVLDEAMTAQEETYEDSK